MSLLDDLKQAEIDNGTIEVCPVCEHLESVMDPAEHVALSAAFSGTIGTNKLVLILQKNGIDTIGRRAIMRHRAEGSNS